MVDYRYVKLINLSDNTFIASPHGYWILPNGDVLCLEHEMTHGEVAAKHEPLIWERIDKEQDEDKFGTKCDLAACDLGWFRINLNQFNGDISCGWGRFPRFEQQKALRFLVGWFDPEHEAQYWWDTGSGTYSEMFRAWVNA